MSDVIQANYDELADVAKRFGAQSDTTAQTLQSITHALDKLQGGDWIGRGSDAFFAEMENEVLPGVRRLIDALSQAGQMTTEINTIIQQADEEASTPFRNGNRNGITAGVGTGDNTAGGNSSTTNNSATDSATNGTTTTNNRNATEQTAYNGTNSGSLRRAIDRFAQMASDIYPAEQGPGSGSSSWQNGTFSGSGLDTNGFSSLLSQRGFTPTPDLSNPYGPGFGLATGDGFGTGTSGFYTGVNSDFGPGFNTGFNIGGNDYGIPRDWLAGVTGDGNGSLNSYLSNGYNDHGIPRDWLSGVHEAMSSHERAGMSVPRNWLSGVMDGINSDLDGFSGAELEDTNSGGGGSSGNGSGSGGGDSGGSSGGGTGGDSPTSASPAETPTTEGQMPVAGGGAGTGAPQTQMSDPYGRGGFPQGYSQTTVSAAEGEEAVPRLRYQPTGGGGGVAIPAQDPPLARVDPNAGWSSSVGAVQTPIAPQESGLRALSLGIAAVSPLLALAGKLVKDKFENER